MRAKLGRIRWRRIVMIAAGSLFVLGGCDPTVRDTVLGGVGQAATGLAGTFIQAFFESLQNDDPNAATTVQANHEFVPQFFS